MVRGFLFKRATGGAVASPFEGGLGGSAPLLVRFLGASEKMNRSLLLLFRKEGRVMENVLVKTFSNDLPVDDLPKGSQMIWPAVLIIQIVRMLPYIECQQWL